jgi:predicted O-methyltransferase YrrM
LLGLFDAAVEQYGVQTPRLQFLPESRYDRTIFPTIGQYDWFSGQLLYCLIRYLRPVRVIEVSCSSGYSSIFMARALQDNKMGMLETFELSPEVAQAAQHNFERFGVRDVVRLHVGDARVTAQALLAERAGRQDREILFLDSEHTETFARFYLDSFLVDTADESLFHMHDILPPHARVMYRPIEKVEEVKWRARLFNRMSRVIPGMKRIDFPRRLVKPVLFDPLQQSSEANFGHRLSEQLPSESQVYVYDLRGRYPSMQASRYDHGSFWQCDDGGRPMEWNDSWWVSCDALKRVYYQNKSG